MVDVPLQPRTAGTGVRRAPAETLVDRLEGSVRSACLGLIGEQADDGHWCYELEADCTIPSEYILMMHFMGDVDRELQSKIATYVRDHQEEHDGWPLYTGGSLNLSASVKAYWALKLAGDDPDEDHMRRAREAILRHGGAARCNVFTRITMALFGQVPWRATPWLPVEIVLLPRWFPFHLSKVSYWSRTVMVPLAVLCTLRARAVNPDGIDIRELFVVPPERERRYFPVRSPTNRLLLALERSLRLLDPLIPRVVRRRAMARARAWFTARLTGPEGLGGIFPAMVNAYEALDRLGLPHDHPHQRDCREALRRLLVDQADRAYCQPCRSPVWDTALAALALEEATTVGPHPGFPAGKALERALDWLVERQVRGGDADWRQYRPDLAPGGWAFQYDNPYYPDLDDTAAVVWALHRADPERYAEPIVRALDWLRGMQSRGGGFASFDADNTHTYLNEIPFADHGALLDPPTADVTARCITALACLARPADRASLDRALRFLLREQEPDGGWFGRWGTNYVYGTWSALHALEAAGEMAGGISSAEATKAVRRAVAWLESVQRPDGSWGESNDSYFDPTRAGRGEEGTCAQTAWALLGLLAAGEVHSDAVQRGVRWLLDRQQTDGLWSDSGFNAPGFPRVFHLRYHGYSRYFPLWALARYRRALAEDA